MSKKCVFASILIRSPHQIIESILCTTELNIDSIIMVLGKMRQKPLLQRTYKFRLYPNIEQSKKLQNNLAVRTHRCDVCGLVLDRDHNASINILKKELEIFNIKLPQELREVTPVEISMRSMMQEVHML